MLIFHSVIFILMIKMYKVETTFPIIVIISTLIHYVLNKILYIFVKSVGPIRVSN